MGQIELGIVENCFSAVMVRTSEISDLLTINRADPEGAASPAVRAAWEHSKMGLRTRSTDR